jgi:ribosomal protein S18 acetylase RimI-like enzyme
MSISTSCYSLSLSRNLQSDKNPEIQPYSIEKVLMLTLKKIDTTDIDLYRNAEMLMVASFPKNEYRELLQQRELTDTSNRFAQHIILLNSEPVGFIAWWQFNDFLFIEHFAIEPEQRNKGLGREVFVMIRKMVQLPIVLETEPPVNEINQRRIAFYERNGFRLWECEYLQPPYIKGNQPLEMRLMATNELNLYRDFEWIKSTLYSEVYLVNKD